MRNTLLLLVSVFLLSACADMDDMWGGQHGGNDYYGGNSGYGNYSNGGGYYPYGNPNYPRDRIYIVDRYHSCRGYIYQGYCYLDKDDYRNAVIWDQNHRNDANWTKKRKDWCNEHDCRRDHDTHDRDDDYDRDDSRNRNGHHDHGGRYGTTDAQGRPLEPRVEKDRAQRVDPKQIHPDSTYPAREPRQHQNRNNAPATEDRSSSQPYTSRGRATQSSDDGGQQVQRYRQQRVEPVQRAEPSSQRQQQAEPVQRAQPASSSNTGERSQSQRRHGSKAVDLGATPE